MGVVQRQIPGEHRVIYKGASASTSCLEMWPNLSFTEFHMFCLGFFGQYT